MRLYTVPKEQAAIPMQGELPAGHPPMDAAPAKPTLQWELPEGWKEGAPSEIRLASFRVKGDGNQEADVSVVPLAGGAGGDLSNVNRWRGQVSLEPVTEAELEKLKQPVEVAGMPADLYEQAGEAQSSDDKLRILAVVQHRDGTAWFFKMMGSDTLVAQQKPVFLKFLKTLRFAAHTHAPVAAATEGRPKWTVPTGWQEVPGGQFLVAKYAIAGEAGAMAAVNISTSAGDGGGVAANLNRWRNQLGLPPLSPQEAADAFDAPRPDAPRQLVDITGKIASTGNPVRLVAAIVPVGGQTWFYKLMGHPDLVGKQKEAFIQFVQGVQY